MNDNKVSHKDDNVNLIIADKIEENFGKIFHATGKKHTFLGMDIEFIGGKKFAVFTPHHIDEALEYSGETLKENVVNPATSQLLPSPVKQRSLMYKKRSVIAR